MTADTSKALTLVAPKMGITASDFYRAQREVSRTAIIRTSDRANFRRCRRAWAWSSQLMGNREGVQKASPLWYGTGIHYALEDYYGWRQFPTPEAAFIAYVKATYRQDAKSLPLDWKELESLGELTLRYYRMAWLNGRDELRTYIHDGVPQVEVNFLLEVPFPLKKFGYDKYYDRVLYAGTIDRVIEDDHGRLWLVDYKTAKVMQTTHLDQNSQVASYCWAAQKLYNRKVEGLIYWQFSKNRPSAPRRLLSGAISTAQNQNTSRFLYKLALIRTYGSVDKAPVANVEHLNYLATLEGPEHDRYIRRDWIPKEAQSLESEGQKIMLELEDMLNPNLPVYPNPTFLCPGCSFYEPCLSMDDGSDWHQQLDDQTRVREFDWDSWRKHLRVPGDLSEPDFIESEPWKDDKALIEHQPTAETPTEA